MRYMTEVINMYATKLSVLLIVLNVFYLYSHLTILFFAFYTCMFKQFLLVPFLFVRQEEQDLHCVLELKRRELLAMNCSKNEVRRFGEEMPAFLVAVEEAYNRREFKRKPVGPIGMT